MDSPFTLALYALGAAALAAAALKVKARLELSRAKHKSMAGHARWGRRIASLIPFYEYGEDQFFKSDNAPDAVAARRRTGFDRLAELYRKRFPKTVQLTAEIRNGLSDLQFTSAYRVPFQYSRIVRQNLGSGTFLQSSSGVTVTDLDGNTFYDLTGSYGVNLFGYDFYKDTMAKGQERARELGPVLGAFHPVLAYNVRRLKEISGLDEVSFHMSGTEAVMQAVRLARYHTRRNKIVRFCGAYHGWWGDVQPGIGNPVTERETYTLADMSDATLRVLRRRRNIACVLVNPLQALHPNANAPSDTSLVDSSRSAHFDKAAYAKWLRQVREVCTERNIVLIFDEVFVGFRLAPGGAQEYFGVKADMVTYGKTVGGGFPIGVVCGRHDLMKRFRDDRPADICFARGTFNSHPYVMGAMYEFLQRMETPEVRALYQDLDATWDRRAQELNRRLQRSAGAGAGGQSVVDLDRDLHRALALQLDAAVLPARGRAGAQLDRHRALHLQPQLHRGRFPGRGRALSGGGQGHACGWLVVERRFAHEQGDQAPDPARDDRRQICVAPACRCCGPYARPAA